MRLITETTHDISLLVEDKDDEDKSKGNNYFIEGIFMQAEQKNRNGRIYPTTVLTDEIKRYNKTYVKEKRAMGELGHPDGPSVNLERVSHLITKLKMEGSNVIGKAKILETPYGKIVKSLMDEGAKLGVSSRGMGSLKQKDGINEVQADFVLAAVDIVADPSAPEAFVNGIMEGREWVWNNGLLHEQEIAIIQKCICNATKRNIEEETINAFKKFMSKL